MTIGVGVHHSRCRAVPRRELLPLWGQRSAEGASVGSIIRAAGPSLFGASKLALDRFVAIEAPARSGGLRPQAPVIDRQEQEQ